MQQEQPLLTMNALWIGRPPGVLEIVCLLSAAARGHKVRLFTYQHFDNVPAEIEQTDAREVLPDTVIVRHKRTGSLALFSDRFRYALIRKGFGAWMDADMLFLKPVRATDGYLYGWEQEERKSIGMGVLAYPPDSQLAADMSEWSMRQEFIPPWLPLWERTLLRAKALVGIRPDIFHLPWGSIGPDLLTYLARANGVDRYASHWKRLYAITYQERLRTLEPDGDPESAYSDETEALHLWHQGLKGGVNHKADDIVREIRFKEGSLLWRVARELGMKGDLVGIA